MPEAPPTTPGTRAWLWGKLRREHGRADELLKRAQWVQAELENVRKQAERDRSQAGERATADLLKALLPTLDALQAAPPDSGFDLVRKELERALTDHGLAAIEAQGRPYDPLRHEAIQRESRPCRDGEQPGLHVNRELRRGYAVKGRVLRPAVVHVVELTAPAGPASDSKGAN